MFDRNDNVMTAKTTVNSILDTLSNNDFVTLLKYANETTELVPCFKDMLIQATPENLDTFKKSLDTLKTEGPANLTDAFTKAFSLLKTYRESRGCDADTPCNQLIMVVTDGIAGNLTEVTDCFILTKLLHELLSLFSFNLFYMLIKLLKITIGDKHETNSLYFSLFREKLSFYKK